MPGKLDVILKLNQTPEPNAPDAQAGIAFDVLCGARTVSVTLRPKMWTRILDAKSKGGELTIAIAGKMGTATPAGFVLDEPNVQVFEKKPKDAPPPAAT